MNYVHLVSTPNVKISIVIPVYNSERTIEPLVHLIYKVFKGYNVEVVLVNDGSKDGSELMCEKLASQKSSTVFISLRKNSGEHNTVMCGLAHATGDYIAIIDDDFQNPPLEIIKLLNKAIDGNYDVVYARYEDKQHSFFRNLYSKINGVLAYYLLRKPANLYLSSFKLINRSIIEEILSYSGPFPYIDALILRTTDNIGVETVLHESRQAGRSNYTFKKLMTLYLNSIINFSVLPLRIITVFGFFISIVSIILIVVMSLDSFLKSGILLGWAFLHILMLFLISITFVAIGMVGEYIGKILMSVNNSPQYVVKKRMNTSQNYFDKEQTNNTYDRQALRV